MELNKLHLRIPAIIYAFLTLINRTYSYWVSSKFYIFKTTIMFSIIFSFVQQKRDQNLSSLQIDTDTTNV